MKIDKVLFSDDLKTLIKYPENKGGDTYIVPDGVEIISDSAFLQHRLTVVVMPDTIKEVGEGAFSIIDRQVVKSVNDISCHTYVFPAKPIIIGSSAFTPFKFYKYHGSKIHDHRTVLRFRYMDTTIPVELLGNWKSNSEELKLAEFIETGDVGRKKSIFYDTNSNEYKIFMAFYLALVHDDRDAAKYLNRIKKKLFENQMYSDLLEYLDATITNQTDELATKELVQAVDLSKWSIKDLPDGQYEIERYKGKETVVEIPQKNNGAQVVAVGESAFSKKSNKACSGIERIIVPEGIVSIKEKAFESCDNLKEIALPASLKEIKAGAFQYCDSLTSIVLPEHVETIEKDLFMQCRSLIDISMGQAVTSIEDGAFSGCAALESIDLPKNLITIGSTAFHGCGKMKSIILPHSLEKIGVSAFGYCKSIETIRIPDKVHIDVEAASPFGDCYNLKEIIVDDTNQNYSSLEGVLFDKERKKLVCYPPSKGAEYVIPDGVEVIGKNAFERCYKLTSITMPESVKRIENAAFNGCRALKKIEISKNVKYIGTKALPAKCVVYTPAGSWADKFCLKNRISVIDTTDEKEKTKTIPKVDYEHTLLKGKAFSAAGFSDKEESDIAKSVEVNGGKYLFNFSTSLDYLIYNSSCTSEPIKIKKARLLQKKGVPISFISKDEYCTMIGE